MAASIIFVHHKDGSPARHVQVKLSFSGGMTENKFTDDHGRVVIEHSQRGQCTVFVSGRDYGRYHAPGEMAVGIK